MTTFTAYIEFDDETRLYVGVVPGVPGAHTQASSSTSSAPTYRRCWSSA
jgi:predicted RNase H-like HicB family nuclease